MVNHGCHGSITELDTSTFARPLPAIGLYIAGASLVCFLLIFSDAVGAFYKRLKFLPCKWFKLNAATLTLLSIATKLPVDLNTSMPGPEHQLAKLAGTTLLLVVMGFLMPSLGEMDDSELFSNMVALAILTVTIVVNVGIQMGTGVIFVFFPEHIIVMCLMLFLLLLMFSSSLTAMTIRRIISSDYHTKHGRMASRTEGKAEERLKSCREMVLASWVMAHTGDKQNLFNRTPNGVAAAAVSTVGALVLIEAEIRSVITARGKEIGGVIVVNPPFCKGDSDYKWSIWAILISQTLTILFTGTTIWYRWLQAAPFSSFTGFKTESYWIQRLAWWKERPLKTQHLGGSKLALKTLSLLRDPMLGILIQSQKAIIFTSKFIRFIICAPIFLIFSLPSQTRRIQNSAPELKLCSKDVKEFVLHLDGEDDFANGTAVLLRNIDTIEGKTMRLIRRGGYDQKKQEPTAIVSNMSPLVELLLESELPSFFQKLEEITGGHFGSYRDDRSWGLDVVVLVHIADRLFGHSKPLETQSLRRCVDQGLSLLLYTDKYTSRTFTLRTRARRAARVLWRQTMRSGSAAPFLSAQGQGYTQVVARLANELHDSWVRMGEEEDLVVAYVEEACGSVASLFREEVVRSGEELYEWLRQTVADIFGLGLSHVFDAVTSATSRDCVEVKGEKCICKAAYVLGRMQRLRTWFDKLDDFHAYAKREHGQVYEKLNADYVGISALVRHKISEGK